MLDCSEWKREAEFHRLDFLEEAVVWAISKTQKQGSHRPTTPSFCKVKWLFSSKSSGGFEESIKGCDKSSSLSLHRRTLIPSHLMILSPFLIIQRDDKDKQSTDPPLSWVVMWRQFCTTWLVDSFVSGVWSWKKQQCKEHMKKKILLMCKCLQCLYGAVVWLHERVCRQYCMEFVVWLPRGLMLQNHLCLLSRSFTEHKS